MSIVQTNTLYNSSVLVQDLRKLVHLYPFLNVQIYSKSVLNKNIYVIKLGRGPKQVFYSASYHANEWITSVVLMKFIEDYCVSYTNNQTLLGYSIRELFDNTSIYIMPMVNPDGVDLVTGNINYNSPAFLSAQSIADNFPSIPFTSGWKANIRGVDLKNY